MKRRPRPRPWIFKLCVFILALATGGAIINVAVAWGCAIAFNPGATPMSISQTIRDGRCVETIGLQTTFGHRRINSYQGNVWDMAQSARLQGPDALSADFSGWPFGALTSSSNQSVIFVTANRNYCYFRPTLLSERPLVHGGIRLPSSPSLAKSRNPTAAGPYGIWRAIPYVPLWPGFAINTLFYAAILWLLFAAPGFIRARVRRKRSLCPACAYPIGTNPVCTECGRAFETVRSETVRR